VTEAEWIGKIAEWKEKAIMVKEETRWIEVSESGPGYPRFWLRTEEKNLLLSWAAISQIEASEDFLSIRFMCEYGWVQLSSADSMADLFKELLRERVWKINGPLLGCKMTPLE